MKKIIYSVIMSLATLMMVNAQKESGKVYSEHENINKTKALWAAFSKGDKETYLSFFADSVWNGNNGAVEKKAKEQFGRTMEWWNKEIKNLSIVDDKPAFPDAIQYKDGAIYVHDWLKILGVHEKSGINLNWAIHNVYRFNKEGKIDALLQYYDNDTFNEFFNSSRTIENGVVYINHPYIVTVRKCVNAYCAEDIETLKTFYSPNAIFWKSEYKSMKNISLEEKMKENKATFANSSNIELKQIGYPDCIYYSKDDYYVVYSWWVLSFTDKNGKKRSEIPVMLTHNFNKEGKITAELVYLSTNHFE